MTERRSSFAVPMGAARFLPLLGIGLILLSASACYVANQPKFERTVYKHVSVGMPVHEAIAGLNAMNLRCDGNNPSDCTRLRQGLMPYSCIERVRIGWSPATQLVSAIDIPKIACAGL
jgi:hypothetical protein